MPAGVDLIFFDDSEDWELVANESRTAIQRGENAYLPIPAFNLGVSLNTDYVAVLASTSQRKSSWVFAGDITQVYNFPKGSSNSPLGRIQPVRTRLFINRLQLIETNRVSTDNFDLRYQPPYWFRNCSIVVYKYTGDKLNFVEDTLFNIGNALGIDPNTEGGRIIEGLLALKLDLEAGFAELNERLGQSGDADAATQEQIIIEVEQLKAGVFTLSEGLSELLPPDRGQELQQRIQNRLDLDLGFL